MRRWIAFAALIFACSDRADRHAPISMRAPDRIRQSLSMITELEATAFLVPRGGSPGAPVALARGDDGVSFSGFIAADPGDYTIEIVFTGIFAGRLQRDFLGRWISDAITVSAGDTASAAFTKPLDVIGRPEDQGDDDRDRFGLLDELIYGTDPAKSDTDGDQIGDGDDCDPLDAAGTFMIAAAGSHEDCDGDGARRIDVRSGTAGTDCDDYNATIRPGAEDLCTDTVDQDCNPATCPLADSEGPQIELLEPDDQEVVGCHRKVRAQISDPAGIAEASVRRYDDATSTALVEEITLTEVSAGQFEIDELNVSTRIWMDDGPERFEIRARDNRGNTSTVAATVTFALDVPAVTMTPAVIGARTEPFEVVIDASAPRGIASIELMRAALTGGSDVDRRQEVTAGMSSTSPARFTIDPRALPDGEYALYPVVVDTVGNRLDPQSSFSVEMGTGGELYAEPHYICVPDPGAQRVPVRQLIVGQGGSGTPPAKMRDHLIEAIQAAAARDPNAQLVEIRGWGIQPDGIIRLDLAVGGDGKWWRYQFFNFTEDRDITVTWYSAAYDVTNPVIEVEENSPFGYAYHPFANAGALVDSDVAAAAYGLVAGCPPLTGDMSEDLRYENDMPFSAQDVLRVDVGTTTWKATATAPVTQLQPCE